MNADSGRKNVQEQPSPAVSDHRRARISRVSVLVWALRIVVGAVFLFSGFAKAVDPWGGLYKISEYLGVMHIPASREATLILAILLAGAEFLIGAMLAVGAFRRLSAWALAAFMLVMTPLTLWIYIAQPVADCGCFGDAVIISNSATFWKNMLLCVAAYFIVRFNPRVPGLIHPRLQWLAAVITMAFTGVVSLIGYNVQPLIDFRPYPEGRELSAPEEPQPRYIYALKGRERSFSADSLPDAPWEYVRREEYAPSSSEMVIFDADGNDITADLIRDAESPLLLLCVSDPARHGISRGRMANTLYEYSRTHDISMAAVIADGTDPVQWADSVHAAYPVFTAEDTDIKELVRGDAALVYIDADTIRWKRNLYSMPPDLIDARNISGPDVLASVTPVGADNTLIKLLIVYICFIIVLWLASGLAAMVKNHKIRDNFKDFSLKLLAV